MTSAGEVGESFKASFTGILASASNRIAPAAIGIASAAIGISFLRESFVTGHDFSRAEEAGETMGFSPCAFCAEQREAPARVTANKAAKTRMRGVDRKSVV